MSSKIISKEELFSNKKSLEIDTSNLDYPDNSQVLNINYNKKNDENNKNQMNTNPQLMKYYYNNKTNNQDYPHNQFQQQYSKNIRSQQQQYPTPKYNQYPNNINYIRNINQYQTYPNKGVQNESADLSIIQSLKYVSEKYPQLIKLNQVNAGVLSKVKNQASPRFFVIKSFTEEDIHKVSLIFMIVYQI